MLASAAVLLVGLTGGIGMGKSTAATLLEQAGAAVVDTDTIARQIVEPGKPAVEEIKAALLHATAYCGIPAGLDAFRAAHEVLVSEGVLRKS